MPITGRSAIGFGLWCARAGDVDRRAGVAVAVAVAAAVPVIFADSADADADAADDAADADDADDAEGHATVDGARRGEAGACASSCAANDEEGNRAFACHR